MMESKPASNILLKVIHSNVQVDETHLDVVLRSMDLSAVRAVDLA